MSVDMFPDSFIEYVLEQQKPLADWSVLEIPGVEGIAGKAARKVATNYSTTIEYDDAYQEALILLASKADRARDCAAGVGSLSLGTLHHELYLDLVDSVKWTAGKRSRHLSYESLREGAA